jgi:hypothetical protein
MATYSAGTRVQDIATGWTGTVLAIPTNSAGTPMNEWQFVPPGFPTNYNDSLILVQWDSPGGGKIPYSVFVSNGSVEQI